MSPLLARLRHPDIQSFCRKHNIAHMYLTGSFARDDAREESDVDIIYQKVPNTRFTLFNIGAIKYALEESLGCEVDLISENSMRSELRTNLERDKILIF